MDFAFHHSLGCNLDPGSMDLRIETEGRWTLDFLKSATRAKCGCTSAYGSTA